MLYSWCGVDVTLFLDFLYFRFRHNVLLTFYIYYNTYYSGHSWNPQVVALSLRQRESLGAFM